MKNTVEYESFYLLLTKQILPFWERAVDLENGTYDIDVDERGNVIKHDYKHLTSISRLVFSFSRGYRLTQLEKYRRLAEIGVAFLTTHLHDATYKGFFRRVRATGEVLDSNKCPYANATAVYALAEFASIVDGEQKAQSLALAEETMNFLMRYAYDDEFGGFFEELDEEWSPISKIKRVGHLLHSIEAVANLYSLTSNIIYRDYLISLCDLLIEKFYDSEHNCILEHFTENWIAYHELTRGTILFGHVLEAAWFIMVIGEKIGHETYVRIGRLLLAFVMRSGYDETYGGIYYSGMPNGKVVDSSKMWWVQCAFLGALSTAFSQTKDPFYLFWIHEIRLFLEHNQLDTKHGELYMLLYRDGTVNSGMKGKSTIDFLPIKVAYHTVQALGCAIRNLPNTKNRSETQSEIWL
ncbi:MAG: AGE family epimerase/isomerase [Sphaerochaeta sp.]